MPGTLKAKSHKEQLAKGWTYLLGLQDIQTALEPRLTRDSWLSLHFNARQAYWKERRDEVEEQRQYGVFFAQYSPAKDWRASLGELPWDEEEDPQVVKGSVTAVPHESLPAGLAVRPVMRELLQDAFLKVTPKGLSTDRSPKGGWTLRVMYDANVAMLEASLGRWNGAEYAVAERLQRQLVAVGVSP